VECGTENSGLAGGQKTYPLKIGEGRGRGGELGSSTGEDLEYTIARATTHPGYFFVPSVDHCFASLDGDGPTFGHEEAKY
jgi:hypothetical protein